MSRFTQRERLYQDTRSHGFSDGVETRLGPPRMIARQEVGARYVLPPGAVEAGIGLAGYFFGNSALFGRFRNIGHAISFASLAFVITGGVTYLTSIGALAGLSPLLLAAIPYLPMVCFGLAALTLTYPLWSPIVKAFRKMF